MKLLIAGSRDFNDYDLLKEKLDKFFSIYLEDGEEVTIISGTARGADKLGENYARENSLKLECFPADWNTHGKKAGILRNIEMGKICTHGLLFWDGKSRGTAHMKDELYGQGKPFEVVYYER